MFPRDTIFKPNWRVPLAPEDDTTNHKPNVVVAIGFVTYGYQIDYYVNGQLIQTSCRDFAGDHKIAKLEEHFVTAIEEAINKARKDL